MNNRGRECSRPLLFPVFPIDSQCPHASPANTMNLRTCGFMGKSEPMDNQKGIAIVTGASGGIGYELAKLFARDGYSLLLVARSGEKLRTVSAELASTYAINATA